MRCCLIAVLVGAVVGCEGQPPTPSSPQPVEPEAPEVAQAAPAPSVAVPPRERRWPAVGAPASSAGAFVHSKVRFLWIRPTPDETREWIGYLALGDQAPLKGGSKDTADAGPGHGMGCSRWYAIEPRGFVCVGEDATLDGDDPDFAELKKGRAKQQPYPYDYGESLGTTVYLNVPPRKRQYFRETAFNDHMEEVARARELPPDEVARVAPRLAGVDLKRTGNPPPKLLLHLGARSGPQKSTGKYGFPEVVGGSTIAYFYSFDSDDRSWVMTWDRGIVPKDRVRVFEPSRFHGLPLKEGVSLPLAFFRVAAEQYRRTPAGTVTATGSVWNRYDWVGLTGEKVEHAGKAYWVTKQDGLLCDAEAVSAPQLRTELPDRVRSGESRTWLDVSITGGWLVAYEKNKPVYTTMVSPGRGGLPVEGKTLLETASTPVGDFTISGKFHTATMTSNYSDKVVHSQVPYTQNFSGPYALHAAYWHDDWGVPKSGGCVNLSAIDAMRIFAWTEPRLPTGWHGMRAIQSDAAAYERATVVSLHR